MIGVMKRFTFNLCFFLTEYQFLNMNENPMRNRNYNLCLENACRRIGIERISMHILRHTFATRCIESGMKPKTLQKILGHANISVTMDLYVHLTEDEKIQEMKAFEESSKTPKTQVVS